MASQTMPAGMKFSINGTPNSHGTHNNKDALVNHALCTHNNKDALVKDVLHRSPIYSFYFIFFYIYVCDKNVKTYCTAVWVSDHDFHVQNIMRKV